MKNGDKVREDWLLIEADLEIVKAEGLPVITPMMIFGTDSCPTFSTPAVKAVINADAVIGLAK